jgi:hypothetical protein
MKTILKILVAVSLNAAYYTWTIPWLLKYGSGGKILIVILCFALAMLFLYAIGFWKVSLLPRNGSYNAVMDDIGDIMDFDSND